MPSSTGPSLRASPFDEILAYHRSGLGIVHADLRLLRPLGQDPVHRDDGDARRVGCCTAGITPLTSIATRTIPSTPSVM